MHNGNDSPAITLREFEVLQLVVEGFSAKEIAVKLKIAPRTVECHIDHLRTKTGARNRAHMAAHAVRNGLVSLRDHVADEPDHVSAFSVSPASRENADNRL